MSIPREHLSTLRALGYTETEARFLYLVATHSGYFTQRHYLAFAQQSKGHRVHRLTTRALDRGHARISFFARNTHVYNLYSRRIYDVIEKGNLRNRRRQSREMVHARLMILDFIIAHPDEAYFETEADKIHYFTRGLGVPLCALPARIYHGIKSVSETNRYFVDRFPIFIPGPGNAFSLPPIVTFTYCDTPGTSFAAYMTHLQNYESLLRRIDFNFIYAAPEPHKFDRARAYFSRHFDPPNLPNPRRLLRYFELRRLWETQRTADLTHADRDFLRDTMRQFKAPNFESAYLKWTAGSLPNDEILDLLKPDQDPKERHFRTHPLPEAYSFFFTESSRDYRTRELDDPLIHDSIPSSPTCEA